MKKYKLLMMILMMMSICIVGCDKRDEVPKKTESIKKIEKYKFELEFHFYSEDDLTKNVKDVALIQHIKAFFNVEGELIGITYTPYLYSPSDWEMDDPVYCAYGTSEDCYSAYFLCYKDKTCSELKKKGESLKQDYEDFLEKYDMTTEELKEYMQYKYSLELSKHE